jgi:3-oxoacyl-[acyl-carrier-protein] synthase II
MGTVNPLGTTVDSTWNAILERRGGIGALTRFDASDSPTRIAGEIKDFDYTDHFEGGMAKKAKRMDPFCHYAVAAAKEAAEQSGLASVSPDRVGVAVGSGIGGINVQHTNSVAFDRHGARRVSPYYIPMTIGNMASGVLSMVFRLTGPNLSLQTACATANHSIAQAMLIIRSGMADAMLAGGTESPLTPFAVAGFSRMQVLSTKNDEPETASRPYDRDRDGLVVGEGAAILVLEEYEHAKRRGAPVICEVASCGMSADAYDFVAPHPEGAGAHQAMKMALDQARIDPEEIGYINAHGTSTQPGDIAEAKAIYRLFNGSKALKVGSTKSYHGHLLGAAAGLEAVITAKALSCGVIPANINLFDRDPELPPIPLPTEAEETRIDAALSNSFGFGGHNSSLLLRSI